MNPFFIPETIPIIYLFHITTNPDEIKERYKVKKPISITNIQLIHA